MRREEVVCFVGDIFHSSIVAGEEMSRIFAINLQRGQGKASMDSADYFIKRRRVDRFREGGGLGLIRDPLISDGRG